MNLVLFSPFAELIQEVELGVEVGYCEQYTVDAIALCCRCHANRLVHWPVGMHILKQTLVFMLGSLIVACSTLRCGQMCTVICSKNWPVFQAADLFKSHILVSISRKFVYLH